MRGSIDRVMDCTSSNFDGIIALVDPNRSWVARWNHLSSYHPGIYASHVTGRIPEYVEDELSQRGITYYPRDGTEVE
ncbi:Transcription elongation factor SPT4 [Smittium culicis]|uniref:Transcription elongation factor SPT4 n=1 Tax=Smittium culicis TaxID=133412 RepID=A0A1R1Y2Y5_9FUNG|nr:Transcription elongation factor SPT4 [Smittium culicis]